MLTTVIGGCTGTIASGDESPGVDGGARAGDAGRSGADGAQPPSRLRVAVVSDLNGSYGSTSYGSDVKTAVARLVSDAPDLVLSTGDMVAGQMAGLAYRDMWSAFHGAVSEPLALADIPFAVSPGNHDASGYSTFAEERAIYVDEWMQRKPQLDWKDDSSYPLRYSFHRGGVLFVALDATTIGSLGAEQMEWLDEQLQDAAEVKIVYGHVPLYPFAIGRETEIIGDSALEDLLNQHGVDAFISGHHHAYYPGRRSQLRLISMACLGSGPRVLIGDSGTSSRSVLMLDIEGDQIESVEAMRAPELTEAIDRAGLPASVGSGDQQITRDDL